MFLKIIDGLDEVNRAYRGTKNATNSSRIENYFLLTSQYEDNDGNTINVPVYINEMGKYNEVMIEGNKIATVYGKINLEEYLNREVANGNLVRIKKRSNQNSETTAPIAAGYEENASKKSIRKNDENVKTAKSLDVYSSEYDKAVAADNEDNYHNKKAA